MAKGDRLRSNIRLALSDGSIKTTHEILGRIRTLPLGKHATVPKVASQLRMMPEVRKFGHEIVEKQDGNGHYKTTLWGLIA